MQLEMPRVTNQPCDLYYNNTITKIDIMFGLDINKKNTLNQKRTPESTEDVTQKCGTWSKLLPPSARACVTDALI